MTSLAALLARLPHIHLTQLPHEDRHWETVQIHQRQDAWRIQTLGTKATDTSHQQFFVFQGNAKHDALLSMTLLWETKNILLFPSR